MTKLLETDDLVARIHATGVRLVIASTGGGSDAIASLLRVPGASRTVLEAIVPYASASLVDWLGATPEQFCSERTARAMALTAYARARFLSGRDKSSSVTVVGLGCTASLASDRPKRGAHRVYVAAQTREATRVVAVEFIKGRRSRAEEERVASSLVLNLLAECAGMCERIETGLSEEPIETRQCDAIESWRELLDGDKRLIFSHAAPSVGLEAIRGVFPGAFNPRHDGHRQMARIASQRLGGPIAHEVSIENVDKLPLDYCGMAARAEQFEEDEHLLFTRAATFVEKTALLPGKTWIVGADTIARIADMRYYDGEEGRQRAFAEIAANGSRFLVFGRALDGSFRSLDELNLPHELRVLCDEVPESDFRVDISSTSLRQKST